MPPRAPGRSKKDSSSPTLAGDASGCSRLRRHSTGKLMLHLLPAPSMVVMDIVTISPEIFGRNPAPPACECPSAAYNGSTGSGVLASAGVCWCFGSQRHRSRAHIADRRRSWRLCSRPLARTLESECLLEGLSASKPCDERVQRISSWRRESRLRNLCLAPA